MLTTSERSAAKLAEAISSPRIKQSTIAAECGVTKQAVQGWLKTGRIDKKHFRTLARITQRPLSWWLDSAESPDISSDLTLVEDDQVVDQLQDWRLQASEKSQEVIDQLTLLARRNKLKDEDWVLIQLLARRFNGK